MEVVGTYRGTKEEEDVHERHARFDNLRDCLRGGELRKESERVRLVVFGQSA